MQERWQKFGLPKNYCKPTRTHWPFPRLKKWCGVRIDKFLQFTIAFLVLFFFLLYRFLENVLTLTLWQGNRTATKKRYCRKRFCISFIINYISTNLGKLLLQTNLGQNIYGKLVQNELSRLNWQNSCVGGLLSFLAILSRISRLGIRPNGTLTRSKMFGPSLSCSLLISYLHLNFCVVTTSY